MFAGVISRDNGSPWGSSGQSTASWKLVPIATVLIGNLWATQPGILFAALIEPTPSFSGDEYPHVIEFDGKLYLEDGHHRVVRAALAGRRSIEARYLRL